MSQTRFNMSTCNSNSRSEKRPRYTFRFAFEQTSFSRSLYIQKKKFCYGFPNIQTFCSQRFEKHLMFVCKKKNMVLLSIRCSVCFSFRFIIPSFIGDQLFTCAIFQKSIMFSSFRKLGLVQVSLCSFPLGIRYFQVSWVPRLLLCFCIFVLSIFHRYMQF